MTTLLLIRHGETPAVANGILVGRMPGVPLTERGRRQAAEVAAALANAPIKQIYSSPMERAQETASYLAKIRDMPVQIAEGIIETDIGLWTGKSIKQCARTKAWKQLQTRPASFTFPGGESFAAIQSRVAVELRAIAERHPEDMVACFTHAEVIRLAVAHFLDMPLDSFQRVIADTCSITVVQLGKDGAVRVPKINQTVGFHWPEKRPDPKQPRPKQAK